MEKEAVNDGTLVNSNILRFMSSSGNYFKMK